MGRKAPRTGAGAESADARRWLRAWAATVRGPLALAAAGGVADGALVIGQSFLIAWIVHHAVIEGAARASLTWAFGGLLLVFFARAGCAWLRGASGTEAAARVTVAVRDALFRHLAALGPARITDRPSGDWASTVVERVEALEGYYARFLPQSVAAVAVPLMIVAAVAWVDWLAGALLLVAMPLAPLFMALVGIGAERLAQRQQQTLARISGHFLDRLRGMVTLRLFRATEREAERVEAAADLYRQRSMGVLRVAFLSSAVLELIAAISIALVAMYIDFSLLGYLHFGPDESLTLFGGLFILLLAPELFLPLRQLAQHYHDRAAATGAAESIGALLARPLPPPPPPSSASGRDGGAGPGGPPALAFDDVHVAFHGGARPAVRGVSLIVRPGERVVIAGPSGAGKSTLLHLAAGFLQPDAGRVRLSGMPPPAEGAGAWVGQGVGLFHGTLSENLRLGAPEATDEALWEAIRAADLEALVAALPHGLDTPLGERGYGLSGGQARRVALARAALSGNPLLLLDEPTNGLDPRSRDRVLAALERLADGRRTVVAAAHDAVVRQWADRVVVLREGRLETADG